MGIFNTTLNVIRTGVSIAILVILIRAGFLIQEMFEKYLWRLQ